MVIQVVDEEEGGQKPETATVFGPDLALELQSTLGRRLQESKTKPTAEEINRSMDELCADILGYMNQWIMIGKRAAFGEGCILYWVEQYWNDLTPFHDNYDSFNDFATQETGEDYATFRAKIMIYRTFVLNEKKDEAISEHGPQAFMDVPIGKLQKAVGPVRKGELTRDQWDALMDPNVNDRQFHHLMKAVPAGSADGSTTDGGLTDDDFVQNGGGAQTVVHMDTGALMHYPAGGKMGIKIGSLEVTTKDDTVREIVDEIIDAADIRRR